MRPDIPTNWEEYVAAGYQREVRIELLQDPSGPLRPGFYIYGMGHLQSGTLTKKLFDKPSIGNAACAVLKFKTAAPTIADKFDGDYTGYPAAFPFYPQTNVRPEILVRKSGSEFLKLPWNTFYTDERKAYARPEGPFGTIGGMEFVCYDRMIYAEEMYVDQLGTYPMPAADVVEFIAGELGISVDERSEIGNFLVDSPTNVYTMREVLRFIAAGSGGNFVINSMGKLQLVPFGSPAETEEQDCSELDYGETLTVTGVRLFPDSEKQYFSGTEDGFVVEGECAYATQELCDTVAAKLIGKVYRPFEAKEVRLDPAAELGDSIRLGGIDFTLASVSYSFSLAMAATVGAPWLEDVEHQIPYQSRDRQTRMTAQSFSRIDKTTAQITQTVNAQGVAIGQLSVRADEISASVSGKVDGEEVESLISAGLNGITLDVTNKSATASIQLKAGGEALGAPAEIKMTGLVTFEGLQNGTTVIDGDCIQTGTIDAEKVTITGTLDADYASIGGQMTIKTAKEGDAVGFVGGFLSGRQGVVVIGNDEGGALTIWPDLTFIRGAALQFICDDSDQSVYLDSDGGTTALWCDNWGVNLGRDGDRWANIYCHNLHDSSDRALKKDITYGLDGYDAFFDALQPCSYRMIHDGDGGKIHTGLIAQDVDAALAAVGLTREEFAGLAMSEKEGASGLVYNRFIALLIDQVQKLKKRVDELEKRNAE